ncbi:nuclear-pore anchor isoform X2 [Medicago truncatula]|uniref:nuclear-pore anchor isoform X2 n=1 Tax=Medicago truncatula TaxID=3880 RepID=UPI000D2F451E|nr:nuclear-pore anchor isoform X2 [Medicago truncatula]XP_039686489.1 nuclear-pore anchor isoform X2 [Medicago truncatula]
MKNSAHKEARVTEVEAELGRCPAACTRLEQEKEILERQNAWLNEELTAKIETSKKMNELSNLPLLSFSTEPWLTSIVTDNMDEENNALVSKITVGVSGTASAASHLRDGLNLAKMYAKYQEAVDALSLRHEKLARKESSSILQQEKLAMELKKHTEEAAIKVAIVLQRAEEQVQMMKSLRTYWLENL